MKIWFDMDGTIANLYAVENWLPKLRASDASPYAEAEVMLNMSMLARYLNQLQKLGYEIGIISWTSKGGSEKYNRAVEIAKLNWLHDHLRSVSFDEIYIVEYGTPKQDFAEEDDILFDDNEEIRNDWTGKAYEPSEILSTLSGLLHQE
jgi:outer membrane protease